MNKAKIDNAVKVMQELTPEERAIVNYTVDREGKRRYRRKAELPLLSGNEVKSE